MAQQTELTHYQKLLCFQHKFYDFQKWIPKKGDLYTSTRADLEIYEIVDIMDGKVFTKIVGVDIISIWDEVGFTSEGFGNCRMFIPEFVFKFK